MKQINIQLQADRLSGVREHDASDFLRRVAQETGLIKTVTFASGEEEGPYINVTYQTDALPPAWSFLKNRLFGDSRFGSDLARATIVVCEGDHGWDDYLLLHHFDDSQPLDQIALKTQNGDEKGDAGGA